jgi:hypothetical protein
MEKDDRRGLDELIVEFNEKLSSLGAGVSPSSTEVPNPEDSGDFKVRMKWVAHDDACPKCRNLAAGSPYTADNLPSWPGTLQSTCGDKCRCVIKADDEDWKRLLGKQ